MKWQRVSRGRGSLKTLPELMEKLQIAHPLIVCGRHSGAMLMRRVPAMTQFPVFSDYHANPDLDDAAEAAALFRREGCDGLISVGGGSAMDTAKAVKAMLASGNDETQVTQNIYPETMPVPHIAVPTTAGTGAETTQFAVVYRNGNKLSLNHPDLRPDGALLDSTLLETLPDYHRKSCAMDALAQGIESYWSKAATEDSRVHAYLAILGVLDNLKAYLAGDAHAADEMLEAAYQSGRAIQITRTTAAHAMSYRLTKTMGISHGHAVMMTLPALWDLMWEKKEMQDVLQNLSSIMRLGHPLMVSRLLRGVMADLGLNAPPMPDQETMTELARSVNPERMGNHPVPMTEKDILDVYRMSFIPLMDPERQACLDIWKYYHG